MEFSKKLQTLRKDKGLTQEELAEHLYVSRTAVSKWESGRGYPSIDSIKEIASFFSVTVDELLSSEKILSIAERENKANIQKVCSMLFGAADLFTFLLIVLPLYPHPVSGQIHSVNLINYTGASSFLITVYWLMYLLLIVVGLIKITLAQCNIQKGQRLLLWGSIIISILAVLLLIASRQTYATILLFVLFIVKGLLYVKCVNR